MTSEVQRFDIIGEPGSGDFTLTYRGETTTLLDHHPAAGDVQDALEALTSINTGNITVTKDGNWGYVCTFGGELADQDLPEITADDTMLGGDATIEVATITHGAGPDTGGPAATLTTPCTLTDLLEFATNIVPVTSGDHHNTTVTSTDTTITVSY